MTALQEIEQRLDALSEEEQLFLIEQLAQRLRKVNGTSRGRSGSLAEMAADPEIQRELRAIEEEFSVTESDGLEGL